MSNLFLDVLHSFKPGSMTSLEEQSTHAAVGLFGAVTAIALAILGAPAAALGVAIFSATILIGALIKSRGIVYSTWIALFGFSLAASIMNPMPVNHHVVWHV